MAGPVALIVTIMIPITQANVLFGWWKKKTLATSHVSITYAGNPVNIATGNKYQEETDIAPGSTPMALEFARHYNSRSTVSRYIGYGWSHTYDRYLSFPDGKILSHREDGRVIYFSADTLEAESGAREKLVHNENGTYTLKTINRVDELYDSNGNLLSITDLNGNTVSLTYQDGHPVTVTDPFGRTLTFSYNPSGKIESITDPAGKPFNLPMIQMTISSG